MLCDGEQSRGLLMDSLKHIEGQPTDFPYRMTEIGEAKADHLAEGKAVLCMTDDICHNLEESCIAGIDIPRSDESTP